MKLGLIAIAAILLIVQTSQWVTATAELQGPEVVSPSVDATEKSSSNKDKEDGDSSSTNKLDRETPESVGRGEASDVPSNLRKASKYIDDQMEAAKAAAQIAANIQGSEADGKNKLLKFAIFERLWSEEVVRKKLQEEILLLEARQQPQEVLDPTPEQVEGM